MKKYIYVIFSFISLSFFIMLVYLSHNNIAPSVVGRAILELVTIPFIVLTVVMLFINMKKWFSEKMKLRSASFLSSLILIITIVLMTVATIYNI